MKTFAMLLICLLTGCAGLTQPQNDSLTEWVLAHRAELDSLSSEAAKIKIRQFLQNKLTNKKFVFIGESAHYIHEKWPYRALIMSVLFEMGYTNIINEMGRFDGKAVDKFLRTGEEVALHKVCLYGMCGGQQTPTAYGAEEMRFFESIRQSAVKTGVQLRYYGWDIDPVMENGYASVLADLNSVKASCPAVAGILNKLTRQKNETNQQEGDRIFAALTDLNLQKKYFKRCFGVNKYNELFWDIRTMSDSFKIFGQYFESFANVEKDPNDVKAKKDMYQIFLLREPTGYDRLRIILENSPEDAKFIGLGHNAHYAKYGAEATTSYKDMMDGSPLWRVMGEMIESNHPGETFHIWMGAGQGAYGSSEKPCDGDAVCPAPPVVGTLEEKFVRVSKSPWIVSLANAPLPKLVETSIHMFNKDPINLKKAADAYFFIPTTTVMTK